MKPYVDEIDNRYSRLVVIAKCKEKSKKGSTQWLCKCDCGNTTIATTNALHSKEKQSCGCLHNEIFEEIRNKNKKHGLSGTRIYVEWSSMKARCYNARNSAYSRYGGRGITVCEEWLNSFENFRDWAYANGYNDDLTIERINVNEGYSPSNCCWITAKEQAKNRRSTLKIIDKDGNVRYVMDVAKELGISMGTVTARILKGWSIEKALYTPLIEQTVKKKIVQYTLDGQYLATYKSIGEASRLSGADRSGISRCCSGQRNHAGNYIWKYG